MFTLMFKNSTLQRIEEVDRAVRTMNLNSTFTVILKIDPVMKNVHNSPV